MLGRGSVSRTVKACDFRLDLPPVRIRFVLTLLGAIGVSSLFFASACSNQGEGERCSSKSENKGAEDCQSGLVCIPVSTDSTNADERCCPADPGQATTAVCKRPSAGQDAAPPPQDSSVPDTTPPVDSGNDTSPPTDAGSDALDAADSADG
jgi:hypothetical protein